MQFFGNINRLRAMRRTLVAPGTMVGLPQFGYTSVISYEKSTACFPIILILAAFRHISFIDTFIVMYHMARHSFASLVTLEEGVPIETISRMLGHNNIQTTQIYARVTPKKLFEDMDKFIEANKDFKFVL